MTEIHDGGLTVPEREVAGHEDLYARIPMAGSDDRWELESRIDFGLATVSRPDRRALEYVAGQVDRDRWEYTYVWFPFDLLPLDGAHYQSVKITTTFVEPEVIARYLAPSPGSKDIPFEGRPTVWGLGKQTVSWQLEPFEGVEKLRPQGHHLACLLQRPKPVASTDVVIGVMADIMHTTLVRHKRTAAMRQPSRYRLSFTEGTFVRLPR